MVNVSAFPGVPLSTPTQIQGTYTLPLVSGPWLPSSICVYLFLTGLDLFWWLICLLPRLACLGYKREEINLQALLFSRTPTGMHTSSLLWLRAGCPSWRESGSAVSPSLFTWSWGWREVAAESSQWAHAHQDWEIKSNLPTCKLKSIQTKAHSNAWKLLTLPQYFQEPIHTY